LPWPIKYLLPAVKWFPIYWPNAEWEIRDLNSPTGVGQPPDGATVPWWKMPKAQWPIAAPWEPKVFGAWPASKVSMPEDLQNWPPFGVIKLLMPGQALTKEQQISFMHMKIHMRPEITHFSVISRNTPMGQKFYLIDKNWEQYECDYREYRRAMRTKRHQEYMELLAAKIAETKGHPQPTSDLFT
jgi:hypothetical protein